MKSKKTIIIVLVVIGLIGAAGYAFSDSLKATFEKVTGSGKDTSINEKTGKKMAFSEFLKEGGSNKCTVKYMIESKESEGTLYIADGKVRGEFPMSYGPASIELTFIVRDGYNHVWTSLAPSTGYKLRTTNSQGAYAWDPDQVGDYTCKTWSKSEAEFTLPAGVTFTAIN